MNDHIKLTALTVDARIGVTDEERAITRPIRIDISIATDTRAAGQSDDLADTISYHQVATDIAELARSKERRLLEHLAEEIAAHILTDKGVASVTVEVEKGDPPIEEEIQAVSVRITRDAETG